jgi:hypothetical protein
MCRSRIADLYDNIIERNMVKKKIDREKTGFGCARVYAV